MRSRPERAVQTNSHSQSFGVGVVCPLSDPQAVRTQVYSYICLFPTWLDRLVCVQLLQPPSSVTRFRFGSPRCKQKKHSYKSTGQHNGGISMGMSRDYPLPADAAMKSLKSARCIDHVFLRDFIFEVGSLHHQGNFNVALLYFTSGAFGQPSKSQKHEPQ